jgi:hypothetical protein
MENGVSKQRYKIEFVFKHFRARFASKFVTIANYLFKNYVEKFNIGMEKAKFHADSKFFQAINFSEGIFASFLNV